jgi:hypothetical protein
MAAGRPRPLPAGSGLIPRGGIPADPAALLETGRPRPRSAKTRNVRQGCHLARHATILFTMRTMVVALLACLRAALMSRAALVLENSALRQQLAVYLRTGQRTRLRTEDRLFWVALRRLWPDWTRPLVIVKPETVIGRHDRASSCSGAGSREGDRSADLPSPRSTSPSSGGSPATTPSRARTRLPRSSQPSSGSSIRPGPFAATWSRVGAHLVGIRLGAPSSATMPKRSGPATS